ncbi:amino acid ABC transporter substrate-binding protein [Pseudodesulfovibrio nedwellii]|uniref:Amino acid ABC transporter substrate-binding protein n=1 Tax=Pseudodesulfovibrio nedwellii TaxID=2973072 RepID=A0ABN6S5N0_9BACT|nr:transporter substrate-binding domain-containing protein [Pseudodesulfovibrio nedwellii]BDQ37618.1 amino acid ABC transporter substrate-binding protein [Pseudodesulfovibrio nedwellii]
MKRNVWLLVAIFCLAIGSTPVQADGPVFLTEENPPFNHMYAGTISGIATDVLLRMTAIAHTPLKREEIQILPWARGYQRLQNSPNVILYSMARTSNREGLFQWIGPIMKVKGVLIARKKDGIRINNLISDTQHRVIGTIRESASEHILLSKGVSTHSLQRLHDIKLNVQKLMSGRVDMVAMTETTFWYYVKELKYDPELFKIVHILMESSFYYGVSSDMNPTLVDRLQKALDQITASGERDRIISHYQ